MATNGMRLIQFKMVQDMTMKKGTLLFVATTMLYMLCGWIGYAAFGDNAPEKLVEAANAAIAIHSVGAYQVSISISNLYIHLITHSMYNIVVATKSSVPFFIVISWTISIE
jgi:hypothetical protein